MILCRSAEQRFKAHSKAAAVFMNHRCCLVILLVVLVSGVAFRAIAADGFRRHTTAEEPLNFDIPAQPLEAALEQYGDITGLEVLYNGSLAIGRRSAAIRGTFTPDAALQVLLNGTSLTARHTSDVSITLEPAMAPRAAQATASSNDRNYYGEIQEHIQDALCANMQAYPGSYRVAARFWIDATGSLQHYNRLGSSGSPDTDGAIDAIMRGLRFSDPPPPGFAQPITIAVIPQVPGVTPGCDDGQ
jgi:hypothetical protein